MPHVLSLKNLLNKYVQDKDNVSFNIYFEYATWEQIVN